MPRQTLGGDIVGYAAFVPHAKRPIHVLQNSPAEICSTGTLLSGSVPGGHGTSACRPLKCERRNPLLVSAVRSDVILRIGPQTMISADFLRKITTVGARQFDLSAVRQTSRIHTFLPE
jgi:hypothetical protein